MAKLTVVYNSYIILIPGNSSSFLWSMSELQHRPALRDSGHNLVSMGDNYIQLQVPPAVNKCH